MNGATTEPDMNNVFGITVMKIEFTAEDDTERIGGIEIDRFGIVIGTR